MNVALSASTSTWTREAFLTAVFDSTAAIALVPVDKKRNAKGKAALFYFEQTNGLCWNGDSAYVGSTLQLDRLPVGSERGLLVVYRYSNAGAIDLLKALKVKINQSITYEFDVNRRNECALIVSELYRRNEQWKFHNLAEGSACELSAFGRHLEFVDATNPDQPNAGSDRPCPGAPPYRAADTGFTVSENTFIACVHLIEGMSEVIISSSSSRHQAVLFMVDVHNNIALLSVKGIPIVPACFALTTVCASANFLMVIGFPMSDFAGGTTYISQDRGSALFGPRNNASLIPFTATVQPTSSASPIFDAFGSAAGMVTSTAPDVQDMNFSARCNSFFALPDACHIP